MRILALGLGLATLLIMGCCLPGWGAEGDNPEHKPSGNVLRRLKDDYKVVHGTGRLLDVKGEMLPSALIIGGLVACDDETYREINQVYSGQASDLMTNGANWLGSLSGALTVAGGLSLLGGEKQEEDAKLMLAAIADTGIDVSIMKRLAGRPRPLQALGDPDFLGPNMRFSSFPSGHTAVAFAMATVLGARHPKQKRLYMLLAGAVGLARIHEHAHFLSDVVAGAMIGMDSGHRVLANEEKILGWRF